MITQAANKYTRRIALSKLLDLYGDDTLRVVKGVKRVRSRVRLVQHAFKREIPVQATSERTGPPAFRKKAGATSLADDLLRNLSLYSDNAVLLAARYRKQHSSKKKKVSPMLHTKQANWITKGLSKAVSLVKGKPGSSSLTKNVGVLSRKGVPRTLTPSGTKFVNQAHTKVRTLNQQVQKPSTFWVNPNVPTGSGGDVWTAFNPRQAKFDTLKASKFAALRKLSGGVNDDWGAHLKSALKNKAFRAEYMKANAAGASGAEVQELLKRFGYGATGPKPGAGAGFGTRAGASSGAKPGAGAGFGTRAGASSGANRGGTDWRKAQEGFKHDWRKAQDDFRRDWHKTWEEATRKANESTRRAGEAYNTAFNEAKSAPKKAPRTNSSGLGLKSGLLASAAVAAAVGVPYLHHRREQKLKKERLRQQHVKQTPPFAKAASFMQLFYHSQH